MESLARARLGLTIPARGAGAATASRFLPAITWCLHPGSAPPSLPPSLPPRLPPSLSVVAVQLRSPWAPETKFLTGPEVLCNLPTVRLNNARFAAAERSFAASAARRDCLGEGNLSRKIEELVFSASQDERLVLEREAQLVYLRTAAREQPSERSVENRVMRNDQCKMALGACVFLK